MGFFKGIEVVAKLGARDGWGCRVCGSDIPDNPAVMEVTPERDETDHLANLGLAHNACLTGAQRVCTRCGRRRDTLRGTLCSGCRDTSRYRGYEIRNRRYS